ncbi:TetR/AcrR family transcriptional regulator [Marivirga arenosa]|uniref:TetR/AcrR family transcriptional regulator n=1 Tax=Marivirga arenosa TaxID=3059076 RepID=A0AA49GEX1_9BACT|nr:MULTISPECIES: TetR/AcrR family transcriptional regulator [unclassified Marivirga]WKK82757.2 TetR/AcrR family transcriptional regulator [Marivirga sp. BKB1-2]WKK86539.2 TetR/AcrR family transcriptional regulator [Marivirga sp. ABR2-2]
MDYTLPTIKIELNPHLYQKDPESSELGRNILSKSLEMIDTMGLERFTFGKLAKALCTTESSIYRYFESKHKLLLYFYNWYWSWIDLQLAFSTTNISDPTQKLKRAVEVICKPEDEENKINTLNYQQLINIVISESSKAYLTKEVDKENKYGLFLAFKKVSKHLAEIMLEINPKFGHANTLASTSIVGILHQQFFAAHMPSLSDIHSDTEELSNVFYQIILKNLQH